METKAAVAHRSAHQCHRRTQSVLTKRAPATSPDAVGGRIALSRTFVAPAFKSEVSLCDLKFVKWLVRKNRALPMSKNDDEVNEFIDEVTDGAYNLPCVEVIFKLVKQMQPWGDERIKKIVAALAAEGIKISIAGDIWYSYSYVCAYFLQYTF